jgi:hypothetical protein
MADSFSVSASPGPGQGGQAGFDPGDLVGGSGRFGRRQPEDPRVSAEDHDSFGSHVSGEGDGTDQRGHSAQPTRTCGLLADSEEGTSWICA